MSPAWTVYKDGQCVPTSSCCTTIKLKYPWYGCDCGFKVFRSCWYKQSTNRESVSAVHHNIALDQIYSIKLLIKTKPNQLTWTKMIWLHLWEAVIVYIFIFYLWSPDWTWKLFAVYTFLEKNTIIYLETDCCPCRIVAMPTWVTSSFPPVRAWRTPSLGRCPSGTTRSPLRSNRGRGCSSPPMETAWGGLLSIWRVGGTLIANPLITLLAMAMEFCYFKSFKIQFVIVSFLNSGTEMLYCKESW